MGSFVSCLSLIYLLDAEILLMDVSHAQNAYNNKNKKVCWLALAFVDVFFHFFVGYLYVHISVHIVFFVSILLVML